MQIASQRAPSEGVAAVDYEFHAFLDETGAPFISARSLDSDVTASVRSFDLLRDNPQFSCVVVLRSGRRLLTRRRSGGKQVLLWAARPSPR